MASEARVNSGYSGHTINGDCMKQNTIIIDNGTYKIERQFVGAEPLSDTLSRIIIKDEEEDK